MAPVERVRLLDLFVSHLPCPPGAADVAETTQGRQHYHCESQRHDSGEDQEVDGNGSSLGFEQSYPPR